MSKNKKTLVTKVLLSKKSKKKIRKTVKILTRRKVFKFLFRLLELIYHLVKIFNYIINFF